MRLIEKKRFLKFEKNLPKNIKVVKKLKLKIIKYSAIKKIANLTLPYSTLKPDTSSDSPSEKSKGVRFNSATVEIVHKKNSGIHNSKFK